MRDAFNLPQSVLVLGGGSEIGEAIARALVARTARRVILAGRRPAGLEQVAQRLREAGAQDTAVLAWDADAVDGHEAFAAEVFARHGDIDLVLVALGVLGEQAAGERDAAVAASVLRTNVVGAASACIAVAGRLRAQGHGTLAVLSSVAGVRVRRSNFIYGASKAGLDAFARGLAEGLRGSGVRVMIVRPGFVHTRMTEGMAPAPLACGPDRVAEAVVDGLQRGAAVVYAPPGLRWLMGALRVLPAGVLRRLDR